MILLDTNVISELWKVTPDQNVVSWMDKQSVDTLYLSAITVAKLRYGIALMPAGKRRVTYQERLEHQVLPIFLQRIVGFDLEVSRAYADLMARVKKDGRAIGKGDGYIAATAVTHQLMVATRDTSPFLAAKLKVINPWGGG